MTFQESIDRHNRSLQSNLSPRLNISDPYLAEWKYEKLKEQIQEFEAQLDSSQEIAICLTSLGASIKLAFMTSVFKTLICCTSMEKLMEMKHSSFSTFHS